jgi:predicted small lipoprotein YifL
MRNFSILLIATILAACGQRGALYLPDQQQKEQVATPAATPVTPAASPAPAAAAQPASPADDDATERERQQRARAN